MNFSIYCACSFYSVLKLSTCAQFYDLPHIYIINKEDDTSITVLHQYMPKYVHFYGNDMMCKVFP